MGGNQLLTHSAGPTPTSYNPRIQTLRKIATGLSMDICELVRDPTPKELEELKQPYQPARARKHNR